MRQPATRADWLVVQSQQHFQKLASLAARAEGAQRMGRLIAHQQTYAEALEKEAMEKEALLGLFQAGKAGLHAAKGAFTAAKAGASAAQGATTGIKSVVGGIKSVGAGVRSGVKSGLGAVGETHQLFRQQAGLLRSGGAGRLGALRGAEQRVATFSPHNYAPGSTGGSVSSSTGRAFSAGSVRGAPAAPVAAGPPVPRPVPGQPSVVPASAGSVSGAPQGRVIPPTVHEAPNPLGQTGQISANPMQANIDTAQRLAALRGSTPSDELVGLLSEGMGGGGAVGKAAGNAQSMSTGIVGPRAGRLAAPAPSPASGPRPQGHVTGSTAEAAEVAAAPKPAKLSKLEQMEQTLEAAKTREKALYSPEMLEIQGISPTTMAEAERAVAARAAGEAAPATLAAPVATPAARKAFPWGKALLGAGLVGGGLAVGGAALGAGQVIGPAISQSRAPYAYGMGSPMPGMYPQQM